MLSAPPVITHLNIFFIRRKVYANCAHMDVLLCGEVCEFYLVFTVETMSRENTGPQECFSEAHRILAAQSAPLLSVDLVVSMHFFRSCVVYT